MAVLGAFQYDGNEATFALAEGAWTDDDEHKQGGSFAAPMNIGEEVSLVTTVNHLVTTTASGSTPVGYLMSITGGTNTTNGRYGTVRLYGQYVRCVELSTASDAIPIAGYVTYFTPGGTYDQGLWTKDGTANDTLALESSSASGSIAAGEQIHVLFGVTRF